MQAVAETEEMDIEDPEEKQTVEEAGDHKIILRIRKSIAKKQPFYSFEFFPPKTQDGLMNLYARLDRMAMLEPLFVDVTWGAGGSTAEKTLEISVNSQNYSIAEVMMHLTCTNMTKRAIKDALDKAKSGGIHNILALRGDPPVGLAEWSTCEGGFNYAVDLVRFIREEYGDYFGVAVAGYPEGHVACESKEADLLHLKEKVDAGADFVITQLFYDVDLFLDFVKRARAIGITCPIIPGIMPIQSYRGFKRMTDFCNSHVPAEILNAIEPIRNDDAAVKKYGIKLGIEMCQKLLKNGVSGVHFYTLNLERSVSHILEGLGFVTFRPKKALPWNPSKQIKKRQHEEIRPIFWRNRPRSYMHRTTTWDEFPNGRWGDSRSPAFGDLSDYHLCSFKTGDLAYRRRIWGAELKSEGDIAKVFVNYISGEIPRIPWSEDPLAKESSSIVKSLIEVNKQGYFSINSQPRVNGAPSEDPAVGWGPKGGYVYQKAYLEFFCSPESLEKLVNLVQKEFRTITWQAVARNGESKTNVPPTERGINAVTWGVFPAKEIIQPTVVDPVSFLVWRKEAFALWHSQWLPIYEPGSVSHKMITNVMNTYFLVSMVQNDFVNGDIFSVFCRLKQLEAA